MLLSRHDYIQLNNDESCVMGHMQYAAYKLWNVCNYERRNWSSLVLSEYPDWYYQKAAHKEDLWYKNLPSQTAQEVCKLLDKSWKSYCTLLKTGGIQNPHPPKFKHDKIPVTYMQKGIVHEKGSKAVRLSLPKHLMKFLSAKSGIHMKYLYLKNKIFQGMDNIKQIKIYPAAKAGCSEIIVVYEVHDAEMKPDNGHYLGIDIGFHNLMTCYDSKGKSFILGRRYLSICRFYDKTIAHMQSEWADAQIKIGIKYPKASGHLKAVYCRKHDAISDYLHKMAHYVAEYCVSNNINTVVIGDIKGIRKNKNLGAANNQKLHGLPYSQLYMLLEYKLAMKGITLVKQKEAYSSQCSPFAESVDKSHAQKKNRAKRGLYADKGMIFNADSVGAYNIMRLYLQERGIQKEVPYKCLSNPSVINVAV